MTDMPLRRGLLAGLAAAAAMPVLPAFAQRGAALPDFADIAEKEDAGRTANLLKKREWAREDKWQKMARLEFPVIGDSFQLPSSSDSDDSIIQRVRRVKQVLKDLAHQRFVLRRNLDGDPLTDEYGGSTAKDVEARLLFLDLLREY